LLNRDEELSVSSVAQAIPQEYRLYEIPKRAGPLILEEGLADDDSWVEEISHDEDEQSATTATEESSEDEAVNNLGDREEELRGYHRQAIDFTLHTIVEESCEESEGEHANASWRRKLASASASELDKYLFFGIGPAAQPNDNSGREFDSLSESSSIFSEGLDTLAREDNVQTSSHEKSSVDYPLGFSRLEKYFNGEFLGLEQDRRDSDGSVGSDSEGRPSPEAQRRKRLVRARGTGRSHSSSLDNLLALAHNSQNSLQDASSNAEGPESQSEGSSTETDETEDSPMPAFGTDGQFDTIKRKKKKPRNLGAQSPRVSEDRNKTPEPRELPDEEPDAVGASEEEGAKTPQPEAENHHQGVQDEAVAARSKQQSRDSGFVGSCDDLLLQPPRSHASEGQAVVVGSPAHGESTSCQEPQHRQKETGAQGRIFDSQRLRDRLTKMDAQLEHAAPNTTLSRKDSFNNWSSDEETNLMMSKMRQFFKTMVANSNGTGQPVGGTASTPTSTAPSPSPRLSGYSKARGYSQAQNRTKPPQLVYFENELTRLMKTVPGIRDEQVREIVEYLSSEDTWSDSYDSSDYTSSDLEGATAGGRRSALQEQISQSCQQIISNFDTNGEVGRDEVPASGVRSGPGDQREPLVKSNPHKTCLGRDTAFVYQKLVQSFTKMAGDNVASDASSTPHSSPPLIAKVMHHIGSRLVALMHEVSESNSTSGQNSHVSSGWRRYPHHRAPSSASTTEDDDSTSDSASAPSVRTLSLSLLNLLYCIILILIFIVTAHL
jgi:synaptotagmin-like protein